MHQSGLRRKQIEFVHTKSLDPNLTASEVKKKQIGCGHSAVFATPANKFGIQQSSAKKGRREHFSQKESLREPKRALSLKKRAKESQREHFL